MGIANTTKKSMGGVIMADIIKKLFGGYLPTTTTPVYTTPSGKRTILRSLTLCNTSGAEQRFYISLGGFYFSWLHTIKPLETLVIPVFDQVLSAGQSIVLISSNANTIMVRLSGEETDRTDLLTARLQMTTTDSNILQSGSQTLMIKSIAICTRSSDPTNFFMRLGNDYVVFSKALKPFDTLFIPTFDQILNPGEQTNCRVSSPTNEVIVHVNAMVVS